MSERAPTSEAPKSADHAELVRLENQLAKKRIEVQGNEAFGKYDITVSNRGETNHHGYHKQRPSDGGIVRNGDNLQYADTGKFASTEAYEAQTGGTFTEADRLGKDGELITGNTVLQDDETSAARYYDSLIGGDTPNEVAEGADYESMTVPQLAVEAARANDLGDTAEMEDIRETINIRLLNEVTRPGTEMTEEDYHEEMARYDRLVEMAIQKRESKNVAEGTSVSGSTEDPANAGESTSDAGANDAETAAPDSTQQEEVPIENETTTAPAEEADTKPELGGEEIIIDHSYKDEDGNVAVYRIKNADGTFELVYAEEIDLPEEPQTEAADAEEPPAEEESVTEPQDEVLDEAIEPSEKEKKSLKERIARLIDFGDKYFNLQYVGYLFGQAREKVKGAVLERNVDPYASFEEQEKARLRNRTKLIAGVIVLAILFRLQGDAADLLGGDIDVAGAIPPSESGLDGSSILTNQDQTLGETLSNPDANIADSAPTLTDLFGNDQSGTESTPIVADQVERATDAAAAEAAQQAAEAAATAAAFNISSGEGGLELFNKLTIDPSLWRSNQESFLANFPQDFYRMEDGGVGISHQGSLSQPAIDAISALR